MALSVSQCREMALRHNEDMQIADIEVEKAELDRQVANNAMLPNLDGSAMGILAKDNDIMGAMTLQMRGAYVAGLTLAQPIYTGGKITAGRKMAQLGKEMMEISRRKTHDQVLVDVDQSYYTLVAVRSKIKMLDAYREQMRGLYDQVETSVRAEYATEGDLLRIDAKASEIDYQRQKAINGEQLCQIALCNAIGVPLDTHLVLTDSALLDAMPAVFERSHANRPEMLLLNKQIELKRQQIKMERAELLPTVALSLSYSRYGNIKLKGQTLAADGNYYPYTQTIKGGAPVAMLSVQIPIWHWGTQIKKMKKAKLDVREAEIELEKYDRLISIEVEQSLRNVEDSRRMIDTAEKGLRQAEENLRVMRLKYDNSKATITDLLDAQSQWQQAQSNLIEAKTQYQIYLTEYRRATAQL